MALFSSNKGTDMGILILRVGIGLFMVLHGYPKLIGGEALWTKIGMSMGLLGIHSFPVFWGFMAMVAEFFGGIFLTLGLFTRPFAIMMAFDMFIAALTHLKNGDGLMTASHAIELGIVFIAFILIGSGPFGLDKKMKM